MTDALLERLSRIDHLTALDLSGSQALTDDGVRHLARLPGLRHLNLSGCAVTDAGLAVLRRLPSLESVSVAWTRDDRRRGRAPRRMPAASARRPLRHARRATAPSARWPARRICPSCARATASPTRDCRCCTSCPCSGRGRAARRAWRCSRLHARPNHLMLRGPFTDAGMARLAGLDGLFALDVDSDRLAHHRPRARAAGRFAAPRVAGVRREGRVDAAHRRAAAPALPDVSGHDRRRRGFRRARPLAHPRAHLGSPLLQPAATRVPRPVGDAGAALPVGELSQRRRGGTVGAAALPGADAS